MKFELTVLGVSAAVPAHGRFPTAQVLQIGNRYFLLDCGEGAQIRIKDFRIPVNKIHHIFISHLHGDHFFGLPGLIASFVLNGRRQPLDIFSPPGLKGIMEPFFSTLREITFPIIFHELDVTLPGIVLEDEKLIIQSLPLLHRIPTLGFIFREKMPLLNIRPDKIALYGLDVPMIQAAKKGEDVLLEDGRRIPNEELTYPPVPGRSYGFITDTLATETILPFIEGIDLLYHETTYTHDLLDVAVASMHTTARQAAELALKANVGHLILGHYSVRYPDISPLVAEARAVFPPTLPGEEGRRYLLEKKRSSFARLSSMN